MKQSSETERPESDTSPAATKDGGEAAVDGGREPSPRLGPGRLVGNLREPIRLTGVNLHGVSAEAARPSNKVKIWTRLALTSDDRIFHRVVENLSSAIMHLAQQAGATVNLARAD